MDKKLEKAIQKAEDKFLTEIVKRYNQHLICSLHSTTGYQLYIYIKYAKINPNYGDKLLMVARALHTLEETSFIFQAFQTMDKGKDPHSQFPQTIELLEEILNLYWKKAVDLHKTKKIKPENRIRWTQVINELMLRGFILVDDIKMYNGFSYVVNEIKDILMVHPQQFKSKKEAKNFAIKFTIGKYQIF